jgi:amino acid transporter
MNAHTKLERSLTLPNVVLFGLAYMTPMIVFGTFGVLSITTLSAVPAAYVVALLAMLFTANSYGQMAKIYPAAGSAYTYSCRTFGSGIGFMVGWSVLLDYLFLPMVIWLIGGAYLSDAFPMVPSWFWILSYIVLTTLINIIGLKVAKKINVALMAIQITVIVSFLLLAILYLSDNGLFTPNFESISLPFRGNADSDFQLIMAGAAIACYSFLGFDAVSTLTEETHNPRETIPKAILWITFIGGSIFVVCSYILQLSFPESNFDNPDAAAYSMAEIIGGHVFTIVFLIGIVLAQLASGIAAQASGSRLLYVMGRDGVISKLIFARLHGKYHTPFLSILFTGVLGLLALELDVATSTSFINFGAFLAFFFVNLSVIFHYYFKKKNTTGAVLWKHLLCPVIGCITSLLLLANLDSHALILGSTWFVLGGLYLLYITKGFSTPAPQMAYSDTEN